MGICAEHIEGEGLNWAQVSVSVKHLSGRNTESFRLLHSPWRAERAEKQKASISKIAAIQSLIATRSRDACHSNRCNGHILPH